MNEISVTHSCRRSKESVLELMAFLSFFLWGVDRTPAFTQSSIVESTINVSSQFSSSIGSGARALAMGGAFIAVADDGTAASWNPAGLCVLERPEASLVWQGANELQTIFSATTSDETFVAETFQSRSHTRNDTLVLEESGRPFDFVSFAYPVRRGRWKLVPQFSFQRAISFSLSSSADPVSIHSTDASVEEISGEITTSETELSATGALEGRSSGGVDIYAASLGVSFREDLYFGVSFNWWRGSTDSVQATRLDAEARQFFKSSLGTEESSLTLEHASSLSSTESRRGFNTGFGVLWRPMSKLRLGGVFKTPFELERTAETTFVSSTGISPLISPESPEELTPVFITSTDSTEEGLVEWPSTIGVGASFSPTESLTLSTDFTWSDWSDVIYEASSQDTNFPPSESDRDLCESRGGNFSPSEGFCEIAIRTLWPTGADPDLPESDDNLRQVDTQQLRFGAEYLIVGPFAGLTALPLRAGAFTDRQYFQETSREPVTYVGITAGFGLVWPRFSFDVAYVHKTGSYRNRDLFLAEPPEFVSITVADDDDTFSSNQIYVSGIVRF